MGNQEALEVLTSVSLLLVVALLVRGFHRHARARAAAVDRVETRVGIRLKWIAVISCAVLMSGVRTFPLAVLIPWWPWWPLASILTWWLLVGYLRGADSTVTVVIGAVSTLVGAVLLMWLGTFHVSTSDEWMRAVSGAGQSGVAGLSLSLPFVLPVGIGTAFLMRRIVGGAPQEDQNPTNLPGILAEFSTPLGRTALWTFAGLLAVLLFDTLALIVLALLFLVLVRRRRARARAAASGSVAQGRVSWGRWLAVTSCAAVMGWVGDFLLDYGLFPLPAWVLASMVTWWLLARYLRGASAQGTVAIGAISTFLGALILWCLSLFYEGSLPFGEWLEKLPETVGVALVSVWLYSPVAPLIGIGTAFVMRRLVGGPPRPEAAMGAPGAPEAPSEGPVRSGSNSERSIWTRPVPA